MIRSYFHTSARNLTSLSSPTILGELASHLPFDLQPTQRDAWLREVEHLTAIAPELNDAHIFLEFMIPRMGRRADVVILYRGLIFVIEYKVGETSFRRDALDQTAGYALDLKHFHEASHSRRIIPVLVATHATTTGPCAPIWDSDGISAPLKTNRDGLLRLLLSTTDHWGDSPLDPIAWLNGRYKPTPTIIEAAQALYRGHDVREISRSEAGAENLSATASFISEVIERSKARNEKAICFVTGVPGSGKTLAGLNIANERMKAHDDEHAVFLSGNGPLVDVLREALTRDSVNQAVAEGQPRPKSAEEYRKASAFIQNIHHFRDEALLSPLPPVGKVVVFDEAQRAWGQEQTSRFMRDKRGQTGFAMSEPEFLLSVMNRHDDWCAVICLIGGGQEINTGEAGLAEWLSALDRSYRHWQVYVSDRLQGAEDLPLGIAEQVNESPALHLSTSIRSFRAEKVSDFVAAVIDGSAELARQHYTTLSSFPLYLTRDLNVARAWLRTRRRGKERTGLLASSNAMRLKPDGIYVKAKIDPPLWFLAPLTDVRSSDALEDVGTEFDVQGLELDWTCVCWDGNFRFGPNGWEALAFKGTRWQRVMDPERRAYLANAYRVLLTRARQGMIIFIPMGDATDETRQPSIYDGTYEFLRACGIQDISRTASGLLIAQAAE